MLHRLPRFLKLWAFVAAALQNQCLQGPQCVVAGVADWDATNLGGEWWMCPWLALLILLLWKIWLLMLWYRKWPLMLLLAWWIKLSLIWICYVRWVLSCAPWLQLLKKIWPLFLWVLDRDLQKLPPKQNRSPESLHSSHCCYCYSCGCLGLGWSRHKIVSLIMMLLLLFCGLGQYSLGC